MATEPKYVIIKIKQSNGEIESIKDETGYRGNAQNPNDKNPPSKFRTIQITKHGRICIWHGGGIV